MNIASYLPSWRLPALSGVGATVWDWIKWAVLGLWRSFWAVWNLPMAYPIVGLVAFLGFWLGFQQAANGVRTLKAEKATISAVANARAGQINTLENANATLRRQVAELEAAARQPAAEPAPVRRRPVVASKPAPAPAPAQPTWWPFKAL